MKYKVGDRVKVKTWEEITKDHNPHPSHPANNEYLDKNKSNRIIKIHEVSGEYCYRVYGNPFNWHDYMIEGLETEIEHARYLFKKSFEEDEDFRTSYEANIAVLFYDRLNITDYKTRNDFAKEIMAVIFDAKDIKPTVIDDRGKIDNRWEILDFS